MTPDVPDKPDTPRVIDLRAVPRPGRRALAALLGVLLLASLPPAPVSAAAEVEAVMPLGDSITDGWNVVGGYRPTLAADLAADGAAIDLVGSVTGGPAGFADAQHEGHPGYRIDQVQAGVVGWLRANEPDHVLLMIGTNDMTQRYAVDAAPTRLNTLIDTITATAPDAEVFVSTIPPLAAKGTDTTRNARAAAYNATIPVIVQGKRDAGRNVHFVDAGGRLTLADLADGVHPSAAGYATLGAAWSRALQPWLQGGAGPTVGLTIPADGVRTPAGDPVTISATAGDPDGVARVEFTVDGKVVATRTAAPWTTTWTPDVPGHHVVRVLATDRQGARTESSTAVVHAVPPGARRLVRAVNLGGPAIDLDGLRYEQSAGAANLTTSPTYSSQGLTLSPGTSAARSTLLRDSVFASAGTSVRIGALPAGTYSVSLHSWEDNRSETYGITMEGATVASGLVSGHMGSWQLRGPYTVEVTDGVLDVRSFGGHATFSAVEVWTAGGGVTPTPSPSPTPTPTGGAERSINLGGGAVTIDGAVWEAGVRAAGLTTDGAALSRQDVALSPSTGAGRSSMLRDFLYSKLGTTVSLAVPDGSYEVTLHSWEDSSSASFDLRVEGVTVQRGHVSGPAGSWSVLGPYPVTVTDGRLDVVAVGKAANLSGLELRPTG